MERLEEKAVQALKQGGIIAYPTEAVYGLGCDPWNENAVNQLRVLKKRSIDKGFILIAADWGQLTPYIQPIDEKKMAEVLKYSIDPITWVFPAVKNLPKWINGGQATLAVRVTMQSVARALCQLFAKPIISTSANVEGEAPAKTAEEVKKQFPTGIDYILEGMVGDLGKPTEIRDAISGKILRM